MSSSLGVRGRGRLSLSSIPPFFLVCFSYNDALFMVALCVARTSSTGRVIQSAAKRFKVNRIDLRTVFV